MVERRGLPVPAETAFIDIIKDTWPAFQEKWLLCTGSAAILSYLPLFVVGLPACIIAFISAAIMAIINKDLVGLILVPEGIIFGLAFAMAYNAVRSGWTKMLLQLARGEGSVTYSDLKDGMPWFWDFFLTMLIIGVGTMIGSLLFVVPGILFAVRTSLAPFLVIDENMGPMEALMKSNEMVSGYSWQIFAYFCIMCFANLVIGFIPLVQIALVPAAMAFFDLALTRIYLYRKKDVVFLPKR